MSRAGWRWALLTAVLAAGGALFFLSSSGLAGVVNSPHDFSATGPWTQSTEIAPSGACSSCHVPHSALDNVLWPRSLSGYKTKLDQRDGNPSSEPNYLLPPSLQCYDCHDYHSNTDFESLNVPRLPVFRVDHRPQDILFGFTKNSLGSMTEYNAGSQTGKTVPGFYETNPVGPGGSPNYGVNLSAPLSETGGHYFKQDPTTSTGDAFDNGDKLPCRDCHDPHSWDSLGTWQAFFRNDWPTGSRVPTYLGTVVRASSYMANESTPTGGRNDPYSRKLCTACHGTSDGQSPVNFNEINAAYRNVAITSPPNTVGEHATASQVACVSCHKHNSMAVQCNGCHSYPGMDNSSSGIKQMSRGHWPHVGKPGTGGTDNSMGYVCVVCHYNYSSRHNGSNNFTGIWWDNVDIQFDPALNPTFAAAGPTYHTQPAYGGAFAKGIGVAAGNTTPTPTCAGLYCHGDNPDKNLMWEGAAKQPAWTGTVGCGDCHKADSTFRQGNHAVHVDNTGANARGPGGIAAFSPAGNCSDGTATGCHTAYGKAPATTHARGTATFRTSAADNTAVSLSATGICANCHSTATAAFDNGAGSGAGNTLAKQNWLDNNYKLPCLTCHNNTSQGNSKIDNTGIAAPNIEAQWLVTGHGATAAIDNATTTTVNTGVDPPVYQNVPVPCGMCHDVNSRHYGTTLATNAWRLRPSTGYDNAAGGLDKFCNTQCHGNAPGSYALNKPTLPQDHTWILAAVPPETKETGQDTHPTSTNVVTGTTVAPLASDKMPLDNAIRQGGTQNFLCVTCHDPHGIGASAAAPRSFTGTNPTTPADNVHMLRYTHTTGSVLCKKCHI